MSKNIARVIPTLPERNPAELSWPATLPVELALAEMPVPEICAEYDITREEYEALRLNPRFRTEVAECRDMLKREGMSFKIKAQLQSGELLKTSWQMIHDSTNPATVRADLIKWTARVGGLEPKTGGELGPGIAPLQINIQLNT